MRHRIFNFMSVLSLLLFIGTAVLWVRSYWLVDRFTIATLATRTDGSYGALNVGLGMGACGFGLDEWLGPGLVEHVAYNLPPDLKSLDVRSWVVLSSSRGFMMPLWIPAAIFVVMPIRTAIRTLRRKKALIRGNCLACGYDLTGNTSGTCPECGAACKAADPAGVSPAAGD